jgi:hypothetical protein
MLKNKVIKHRMVCDNKSVRLHTSVAAEPISESN